MLREYLLKIDLQNSSYKCTIKEELKFEFVLPGILFNQEAQIYIEISGGDGLQITVKLFATFRIGRNKVIEMELPKNTTPLDVINRLNIKKSEVAIMLINGRYEKFDSGLKEGDLISLFPPVGGG